MRPQLAECDTMTRDLFAASAESRARQIFERFKVFHADNPEIWELFKKYAKQLIDSGRDHYSSDCIMHRIRWHVVVDTRSGEGLKINDHYTAYYARMWLATNPDGPELFQLRKRPSVEHGAYEHDIAVFHTGPSGDERQLLEELRRIA